MKVCSLTDIGRKREMDQDYLYTSEEPVGNLQDLFLVADGMGGHNAGEFASCTAVTRVVRSVMKNREQDEAAILKEAIRDANSYIKKYADLHPQMQGMGTTLVAATIHGSRMTVANVGDSRLYLIPADAGRIPSERSDSRKNDAADSTPPGIVQITQDHSLVQELVRIGEINEANARNHPDRNKITRAIGVEDSVEADFFEIDLPPAAFVMLCTDGLSNMVEDPEIQSIILGPGTLEEKTARLIDTANEHGGSDTATVILIQTDEVKTC